MTATLDSVETFLRSFHPFLELDREELDLLTRSIQVLYRPVGDQSDLIDPANPRLFIIRKGAIDLSNRHGHLIDRLETGGCFGFSLLLTGKLYGFVIDVIEEVLLYAVPAEVFHRLRQGNPLLDRHFNQSFARRFELKDGRNQHHQVAQKTRELMTSQLVTVGPTDSVHQAAQVMTEQGVSSVLVVENAQLHGILTDRDIRARLVAKNLSLQEPVTRIMTRKPITIGPDALFHEATFRMLQKNIHHLPVAENGRPIGMLVASDLLRIKNSHPLYIVNKIAKCKSVAELKKYAGHTQELLYGLIRSETTAENIGQVFTSINDMLTKRLVQLAQKTMGTAPVPFCWVSFGSQARFEQHAGSDQDNGIIYDGGEEHQQYFVKLAEYICSGLNVCGFPFCPGDVMAQNTKWCQPLDVWFKYFENWIRTPDPEAMMHCSIFFDIRAIAGDTFLCHQLRSKVLGLAKTCEIFLAMLANNTLKSKTPLGFFNKFIVVKGGDHHQQLDLKHQGLSLITDLARIYSLANGIDATRTPARLRTCIEVGALGAEDARNLLDAFEFIAQLRFQQQLDDLEQGKKPSNFIAPHRINSLQRNHLKAVFRLLDRSQQALALKFTRGMA